jgi:hypothetical protein
MVRPYRREIYYSYSADACLSNAVHIHDTVLNSTGRVQPLLRFFLRSRVCLCPSNLDGFLPIFLFVYALLISCGHSLSSQSVTSLHLHTFVFRSKRT